MKNLWTKSKNLLNKGVDLLAKAVTNVFFGFILIGAVVGAGSFFAVLIVLFLNLIGLLK